MWSEKCRASLREKVLEDFTAVKEFHRYFFCACAGTRSSPNIHTEEEEVVVRTRIKNSVPAHQLKPRE